MPVSARHKAIFVHIPKTGGTSLEQALGIHRDWRHAHLDVLHGRFFLDGRKFLLQHMPLAEVLRFAALTHDTAGWFRFAFVRNPWDRLVSEYFWVSRNRDAGSFEAFVDSAYDIVLDRRDLEGDNCHLRPQAEFLDGPVDFLGRFERYAEDAASVLARIGVAADTLPHEYRTGHAHYSAYYNDRTRRRVYDAYGVDIARFGYRFETA